jgi:YfiH family protein
MTMSDEWIKPDWPAPANIHAITTTRIGGVSLSPYDTLNLADHVGDNQASVKENRRRLVHELGLPGEPRWLKQVHGTHVPAADEINPDCCEADAAFTSKQNTVCAVLTADCLPILLCNKEGTQVAVIHAGWRGLLDGVIESTIRNMGCPGNELMAWLGPAIGPDVFEVGPEVRDAFIARRVEAVKAFTPALNDRWMANIYTLASQRLAGEGLAEIYGGNLCTYSDPLRFYSYRRDGLTGRMATLIWISPDVI